MRSTYILSLTLLFTSLFAQAPQGIKYQAVARDNSGALYVNEQIAVRFSIVDSNGTGPVIYSERHVVNTNDYGLFTASLGAGTVLQGTFSAIAWGAAAKYLKIEFDPAGGTNYFDMGTSQLLSVPYALYAQTAGSGGGGDSDNQTLSVNGDQLSITNGNTVTLPTGGAAYTAGTAIDLTGNVITNTSPDQTVTVIGNGQTVVSGAYPNFTVNTPAQTLSLNGDTLSISDGNSVTLPAGGGGSYVAGVGIDITGTTISNTAPDQPIAIVAGTNVSVGGTYPNFQISSAQPPQVLSLNANTLSLSNGGGSVNLPVDLDNDPVNELQTLTLNGSQLTISNGNSVSLPSGGVPDADSDSTNELNSSAALIGTNLEITDAGGTLTVDLSSLAGGSSGDTDSTNELNTSAALVGTNLQITDAGGTLTVDFSSLAGGGSSGDTDSTNELNTSVVLNGATLEITDAGGTKTVNLSSLGNDADSDPANELNTGISFNPGTDELSITDAGGTLTVSLNDLAGGSGGDTDSTNELISSVVLNGTTLEITDAGGTKTADLSSLGDDADSDPANEIQVLSLNGDTIKLSNGGGSVVLPAGGSGGTLDAAYDFGGAGAGRNITADAGAVEITTATNSQVGFKVTHSASGVAINAVSTNPANGFSTIQAESNSTDTVAAVLGSTTAEAYAVAGQASPSSTVFAAMFGNNLRTNGGAGVEGDGFNGTSGRARNVQGFGLFGENLEAASGQRAGNLYAAGVGSIGFFGVVGQTIEDDGAGVFGTNLGPTRDGSLDNPGVEGIGFVGVVGTTNTPGVGFGVGSYGDMVAIGSVIATGNVTSGGFKPFRIDYPLDPANKFLFHFAVESDEVLNLYRGTVQLNGNGEAVIELPVYFESVNKNFSYQLTPIGAAAPGLFVKSEIENNKFSIAGGLPGQKISWQVTAERNDRYAANHPEAKEPVQQKAPHQVGKYVHPEEYGKSENDAIIRIKSRPIPDIQRMEGSKATTEQIKLR